MKNSFQTVALFILVFGIATTVFIVRSGDLAYALSNPISAPIEPSPLVSTLPDVSASPSASLLPTSSPIASQMPSSSPSASVVPSITPMPSLVPTVSPSPKPKHTPTPTPRPHYEEHYNHFQNIWNACVHFFHSFSFRR